MRRLPDDIVCPRYSSGVVVRPLNFTVRDLHMRLAPAIPALRRWRLWVGAILVAEVCWFALIRPRIAGNFHALLMLALDPLAVVGYVYLMAAVSAYLTEREWDFRLRQMIVIMLGLSAGCFVFALLWLAKVHSEGELG